MFDRIAPVYDVMNRVMTVGLDQRWRRPTVREAVRPGDDVLDACLRHRRPRGRRRARPAPARVVGARLLRADARACAGARRPALEFVQGDVLALPFERRGLRRRPSSASGSATSPISRRRSASCGACSGPAAGSGSSRSRTPRGAARAVLPALVRPRSCRCSASVLPGGDAYTYLPASVRRFPAAEELAALLAARAASRRVRFRLFAGAIVALHVGEVACVTTSLFGLRSVPGLDGYLDALEERLARSGRHPPRARRRRGERGARAGGKRLRPALVFLSAPPGGAVARGRRRGRARPHGDARPRRPDRPRPLPPRQGRRLVDLRARGRARDRRLPLRARLLRAERDRRCRGGRDPRRRHALSRPRRGAAADADPRPVDDGRGVPRALRAQDGEAVRGRVPARRRLRRVRPRARDRVPDRRRRPRLLGQPRSRRGRSPAPTSATGRRRCRSCSPRSGMPSCGPRSPAGLWTVHSYASPRPGRSTSPAKWRSTTLDRPGRGSTASCTETSSRP